MADKQLTKLVGILVIKPDFVHTML